MKKQMKRTLAFVLTLAVLNSMPGTLIASGEISGEEEAGDVQETEQYTENDSEVTEDDELMPVEIEVDRVEPEGSENPDQEVEVIDDTASSVTDSAMVETFSLSGSIFDDVNQKDWFCSYVEYVLNKGIMTGKGENKFAPSEYLSRAQFVTVLYRMSGQPAVKYSSIFPDVPDGTFFTSPVMWASGSGVQVIKGYDNGYFGPSNWITREQMAVMLYRYAEFKGIETDKRTDLDTFPDASKVSGFALDAMQWAVAVGIITGDNGYLNPQGSTSRAVCATMIQRFCETYMQGELEDVDISASCEAVTASVADQDAGTFWVKITGVKASHGIQKIQVPVWCNDDQSDICWYTAQLQSDGSYAFLADVKKHSYHFGVYKMDVYVLLENGVRLNTGTRQSIKIEGTEAKARVYGHVNEVYKQTGKDLNACYWWVVNNLSYYTLPIPLDPPEGYTRSEWYSIWGFEQRKGNCYVYAATFYYLAKGLGYDVEYVEGQVGLAAGGYGPHGWVLVHLDGGDYICDPEAQSEENLSRYNFYMQPVNSPVLQYKW